MHFLPRNICSTIVQALDLKLLANILNMVIHLIQGKHLPTLKETIHYSVRAFISCMLSQMLSNHLPAFLTVWTLYLSVKALVEMLVNITNFENLVAILIWTIDR